MRAKLDAVLWKVARSERNHATSRQKVTRPVVKATSRSRGGVEVVAMRVAGAGTITAGAAGCSRADSSQAASVTTRFRHTTSREVTSTPAAGRKTNDTTTTPAVAPAMFRPYRVDNERPWRRARAPNTGTVAPMASVGTPSSAMIPAR